MKVEDLFLSALHSNEKLKWYLENNTNLVNYLDNTWPKFMFLATTTITLIPKSKIKQEFGEISSQRILKILEKEVKMKRAEIESLIEIPPNPEMGDYAFPCFFLAAKLKKNPNQIALEIKEKIKKLPSGIQEIKVSGPYVNFFINREKFAEKVVKEILEKKNFGRINLGKGKKALIEHTSINPNASPHVG